MRPHAKAQTYMLPEFQIMTRPKTNSPHRFESHVVGNKKTTERLTQSLVYDGADNGIRTRDPHLGKVMLYQLSHVRILNFQLEATPGFEPGVKALQASALPLGHVAILASVLLRAGQFPDQLI